MELEITHIGTVHYFGLTRLTKSQYVSYDFNTGSSTFHINILSEGSLLFPTVRIIIPSDACLQINGKMFDTIINIPGANAKLN